jgi:predicted MPP superfamily phosphohydrolase
MVMGLSLYKALKKKYVVALAGLFLVPALGMSLEVKKVSVIDRDIPAAFTGVRIAFVTDIHRGPYVSQAQVQAVVERVNALKPDVVLFGGDYAYRSARYFAPCFAELQRVHAAMGKFGVFGNHDHWYGIENARTGSAGAGIVSLENSGSWLSGR